MPPTLAQRLQGHSDLQLQAANGSRIKCYGVRQMPIHLPGRRLSFPITIADVKQPILGADFLAKNYLAPNHRDGTLIDLKDMSTIKVDFEDKAKPIRVNHVSHATNPYYKLLDNKFPEISNPSFRVKDVDHGVYHYIPTEGPPVQARARKLDPEKLAVAKAEIDKLVELGVCERGKSDWSSPLLVTTKPCNSPCTCETQKPCGGWRVCGDYRRLNHLTTDDRYPVRNLQDFNSDLRGKTIFSKVDLLKGYHQIPVNPSDVKKTAVITPFGLFLFPRCPFGLKNAGQDFQRLMDKILGEIPHVFVYLDDILIASSSQEEHLQDLERVFSILEENGLVVNRKKCVLGESSIEFLGHICDAHGIKPLPCKVEAIRKVKPPTTIKELQRFLGMINYYRRFIKAAAHHLFHLFEALGSKPKRLLWSPEMQKSFDAIKEALAAATMLHHPDPSLPLALTTDASDVAIGAVIEQRGPNGWEPLAFFSKKLSDSQQNWSPYDRELHAVHKGVRHFKHMLEGRSFTIYTDHQSLVPSMAKKTDAQTARQSNQLSEISEYSTDIRYLEGKSNVVADALSRPNGKADPPTVSNVSQPYSTMPEHVFRQDISRMREAGTLGIHQVGYDNDEDEDEPEVDEYNPKDDEDEAEDLDSSQQDADTSIFEEMEARFNKLKTVSTATSPTPARALPPSPSSKPASSASASTSTPARALPPSPSSNPAFSAPSSTSTPARKAKHVTFSPMISAVTRPTEPNQQQLDDQLQQHDAQAKKQIETIPELNRFFQPPSSEPSLSSPALPKGYKPVPEEKLEDLQLLVNSVNHYSIDLEDMARQQALDPELRQLRREAQTGLSFRKVQIGSTFLFVDVSNGPARPFVPLSYRRRIFNVVHGLGHPGVERTRQSITDKFVWPNIKQDVCKWARECVPCQQAKIQKHVVPPIADFAVPAKRFQHLHIDLVSMPPSNGFNHLLTVVDRFTRWPVAIPIADINAETVVDSLTHGWIAVYGVPEIITTDRGSQFSSQVFTQLLKNWGIRHIMTTAYHPESNGMVERLHRRLKESLVALGDGERLQWYWKLPMTLLALRTTVKPDIGASPSELVFGEGVTVPGQLIGPPNLTDEELLRAQRSTLSNLRVEVERLQPKPTSTHRNPRINVPDELSTATHVLVRKGVQPSLTAPYEGPYKVIARTPTGFRLQFPGRGTDIVALSRLKPAIIARDDERDEDDDDEVTPPSPPPPGRPPGVRTRQPDPTTRQTRSATQQQQQPRQQSQQPQQPRQQQQQPRQQQRQQQQHQPPSTNEPNSSVPSQVPCSSRDVQGEPIPDSPPPPPPRRARRQREQSPETIDPTGRVPVPDDPNLATCPDPVGEQTLADAYPHLPCPLSRDPRDTDQPLLPPSRPNPAPANDNVHGGVRKPKVLSFSNPQKGNFSYRRRRPDVSALRKILIEL